MSGDAGGLKKRSSASTSDRLMEEPDGPECEGD